MTGSGNELRDERAAGGPWEQSITNVVDGYAAAVRAKDVDAFVAFYDPDYETSKVVLKR